MVVANSRQEIQELFNYESNRRWAFLRVEKGHCSTCCNTWHIKLHYTDFECNYTKAPMFIWTILYRHINCKIQGYSKWLSGL